MSSVALTQVGRYRILAELGRGAMGVVYKAEDPLLNRAVAIKTIILSPDPAERAEYEARFYQEARAAGGLNHPNVITIHDIGREGDIAYMALELLEGVDLRQMMRRGPIPLPLALDIVAQVATGLAFAHGRDVIHRDIKPGNIMIVSERHAKIMDFGIARMRVSDIQTQTGAILGSPKYMSPEQVTGMRADHRSDIFSLGIVLYELAAGAAPFAGVEISQTMHQIATATPPPPSALNPSLPPMVDMIAAKALQKTLDARYQSAAELAADLRACLEGLSGAAAPEPHSLEAPVRVDVDATTVNLVDTTLVDVGSGDAAELGTYLYLSRRFNSADAVRRLTASPAAEGTTSGTTVPVTPSRGARGPLQRLWKDPELRAFAAAVAVATVAAFAIALW